ncbi:MAG: hypothetical protein RL757_2937 [Bacteroidota bacterium]|jgi:GT2 family glycosyltransferase
MKFKDLQPLPSRPKVAVVILNYNSVDFLRRFLPSVVRASKAENYQIVVADNASTDLSVAFLKENYAENSENPIQIIELTQNFGFAEGYNQALRAVEADVFVLLNSDVEVAQNWTLPLVEAMKNDATIGIGQPKILSQKEKAKFEYAGAAGGWLDVLGYPFSVGRIFATVETDLGQYDGAPKPIFWASGAAMFIRSDVWRNLGGFDGDFFAHMEEIDFCWRAKRAGFRVVSATDSTIYHVGGGTLDYLNPRKTFLNFRNNLSMLVKNESAAKLFWLIPVRLVLDGVAGLKFVASGDFAHCWAIVRAHFAFYAWLPSLLRKRKLVRNAIENAQIGLPNQEGIYPKSIVINYFLKGIKTFSDVKSQL